MTDSARDTKDKHIARLQQQIVQDQDEINRLRKANAALVRVLGDFEVREPDADGDVWLVFHPRNINGRAAINLGKAKLIVAQVAALLEEDRKAAIANATREQS